MAKKFDITGAIISYEAGELRGQEVLELFSHLIKMVWRGIYRGLMGVWPGH